MKGSRGQQSAKHAADMHRPAAPRHENSPSEPGQPRLRKAEQQLRAVLDASLAAIVFLDRDGYVLDCNEPYAARFGLSRDEILNTCVWGRHPEDVERQRRALMAEVFNTGTPILREDKRDSVWNRYRIAPASRTPEGKVASVVVEALDITEFKHRENRLRETEERLRISFDTDLVAMAVSRRRDGMYLEATPGFLKISGYSREEVVGHTSRELKFFSAPQRRAMLEALEKEGRLHNREMTFPRKDGVPRTILFSIGPICVADEDCLLATMVDITERKKAEEQLRESEARVRTKLNALLEPEGNLDDLELSDLIDCKAVQSLMDDFYNLTGIGVAVIDTSGTVLVARGWQDVCTGFHRVHPDTHRNCIESDTQLSSGVEAGTFKIYKCKNNLWDMATPIMVGGKHLGNLFLGQFFFEGESPDIELFRRQARKYGFDEEAYLAAYQSIPRWSRETVNNVMTFYCNLINVISGLSYAHIKLARTTEALRDNERRLLDSQRTGRIGHVELDVQTGDIIWADMVFDLYERDPAAGTPSYDEIMALHNPEDAARLRECIANAAANAVPYAVDLRVNLPSGRTAVHHAIGTPVTDPNGEVTKIAGTVQDITEQKTAERMLRESEIRFRELAELLPEVVFEADQDNRLTFANRKAFEVFGYSPEDMVSGLDGFGMIHPDDRPRAVENFRRRIRGREIGLNEYTGLRKDGSTFPMLLHTDPIMREGTLRGIRGVLIDITERKKAEAEFADNRTRLALALEGANLGTWDWHIPSGRAVFSDLWAGTKGYELSELKPHISTWENLVHPDDLPDVRKRLAEHLDGTTTLYEATFRMRHKSGKWIWIADKGKVIERDPDGTPVRACGINQDITETKKLNERLRQAEKMESIGTLAGGIAHDFNNILGAVIGYADMSLADVPPGSRLETNLRRILQGGARAGKLVNQILNFSRRAADEKSPQLLRPVIREVVEMMRASLPSTIEIRSSLARDSQPVLADPTRIHEIVMNLCTNAAQAMEDEKGLLEVLYEESDFQEEIEGRAGTVPPGSYSVITVRDNGRGMDEETLERVFEPFFTTKPLGRGTGMGMAVLFGIVQEHRGTVTVESTLGTGTTFRVYLPRCDDTREADTGKQGAAMVPGGTERIMVVDDEDIMIEMARDMLSELGYSVTALNDPVRALDTFRNNPNSFDLLVTDQTMPALPGMELARETRKIRPDLPIILCTGYSTLVDEEKALATGIDGFLTKPFRQRVIAYKIRFVLREKAAS